MAEDRISSFLPHGGKPLLQRLRTGRTRRWRGAPNDASIPFTPPSSEDDHPAEHDLREAVEGSVLRGDFPGAQRAIGALLAEGNFLDTGMHLLGVVRLFQGDSASASDCLRRALDLRAEIPESEREVSTRNALARVAMFLEEYEGAWGELDRALLLDPFSLHLHWNRLCLARDQVAHPQWGDPRAHERLDAAQQAMSSIDPGWRDEALVNPYILSLK